MAKSGIENCVCFYTTGFFLEANWEATLTLAKFAHDKNRIFGFNFAAPYTFSQYKEKILEIMKYCDFIFCNKQEALACAEYLHAELGLDTEEKRTNLQEIASAISSFNKLN